MQEIYDRFRFGKISMDGSSCRNNMMTIGQISATSAIFFTASGHGRTQEKMQGGAKTFSRWPSQ